MSAFTSANDREERERQRVDFLKEKELGFNEYSKPIEDLINDDYFPSDLSNCNKVLQQSTVEEQDLDESGITPSKRKQILDCLSKDWMSLSAKKISKDTGIKHSTVRSYLRRLKIDGIVLCDDHRYSLKDPFATPLTGHRGATPPDTARGMTIYSALDFSKIQHFNDLGTRLQNLRVVSGELELGCPVSPLSIDVPYGCDRIHLDVSYGLRESRFNWTASVSTGIHVDDLVSFGNYVSAILSYSVLYTPADIFYEDLIKAKWYARQVEVLHDDYTRRIGGYYELDTLKGVVMKYYDKPDCMRSERRVLRMQEDTTIPDLVAAVHGSASQIDSNVRVKLLEKQVQHLLDSHSYLISKVGDLTRAVEASMESKGASP